MVGDHKVVTITPVGRKKYLELLYPYLLRNADIVDQHIFWIATDNEEDIAYVQMLCEEYPGYFKIYHDKDRQCKFFINDMFRLLHEKQTIYMKIADDICWIDSIAVRNMVEFKIMNKHYLAVYPSIINTGVTTGLHQTMGHLPLYLNGEWDWAHRHFIDLREYDGVSADVIHNAFLRTIKNQTFSNLYVEKYLLDMGQTIDQHVMCWHEEDFHYFNRSLNIYDKDFLCKLEGVSRQRFSCVCGYALMSHFSYSNQEEHLLKNTFLYNEYRELSQQLLESLQYAQYIQLHKQPYSED